MRWVSVMLVAAAWAADNDTFQAPRARDWNERSEKGRCAIKVWVDDEVDIYLQGDIVTFRTVRGQRARDAGTTCTQPMPRGNWIRDFEFKGIDGRGRVELMEEPTRRNGFRAWVRIRDHKGGGEEHHFRLSWRGGGRDEPSTSVPNRRDRWDGRY